MSKGSSVQYPLTYPRFKLQKQFPAPWTCANDPPILPVPTPVTAVFTKCNTMNQHCQAESPCFMDASDGIMNTGNPQFPYSHPQVPLGKTVAIKRVWDADTFPTAYSDPAPILWGPGM